MPTIGAGYGGLKPAPERYTAVVIRPDAATAGWLCRNIFVAATDIAAAVEAARQQLETDSGEVLWSVLPERPSQLGWLSREQVER